MVNTVVMTAPPRCDLLPSSCVNNEMIRFNRHLKKVMVPFNNVKILETNLEREYFTKHGLHLNSAGKECIALRLSMMVRSCLNKNRMSPIRLKSKYNTTFSNLNENNKEPYEPNCNAVAVPQSQTSTSTKETLGKELQESSSSTDKANVKGRNYYSPPASQKAKEKAPRHQDFYGQNKTCIKSKPNCQG